MAYNPFPESTAVRPWVWIAFGVVTLLLLGLASEFAFDRPMTAGKAVISEAMVGTWQGSGPIRVSWTERRTLPIRIVVAADGSVSGQVGDARLNAARLTDNRGWFSRLFGWRTEYIVLGRLVGPLIAMEAITRPEVQIPLDFQNGRFSAEVQSSGCRTGTKMCMMVTTGRFELAKASDPHSF